MESTIDEVLATLAGMGFELDQCQAAVDAGKVSVQDAVDWILQRGASNQPQRGQNTIPVRATPSLSLRAPNSMERSRAPGNTTSYPAFSLPPVGVENTIPAMVDENPSPGPEKDVVSRFSLSDNKREDKDRWEKQKRMEDTEWVKKNRKQEKEAKANILKEIQADREARKKRTSGSSTSDVSAQSTPAPTSPVKKTASNECLLQIRLPSGKVVREKFPSQSTLSSVISKLKESEPTLPGVDLVQPFPPKTFKESEDFDKTLVDLSLTPSASLVARLARDGPPTKIQRHEKSPEQSSTGAGSSSQDEAGASQSGHSEESVVKKVSHLTVKWGGKPEEEEMETSPPSRPDEPQMPNLREVAARHHEDGILPEVALPPAFMHRGGPPAGGPPLRLQDVGDNLLGPRRVAGQQRRVHFQDGRRVQGLVNGRMLAAMQNRGQRAVHHDWGEGQRLHIDEEGEDANREQDLNESPNPALAAAAALQRLQAVSPTSSPNKEGPGSDKPISPLSDLCFKCVLKNFKVNPDQHPMPANLEAVPPLVALRLIEELKSSGSLRPKVLQLFLPCRLHDLSLDCYKYTTNELLQCVGRHTFLTRLSVAACPLVTDQGLMALSNLKRLQLFNLCNNKQVTDKVFHLISELPSLTSLILDGTSVTDSGLGQLVSGCSKKLFNLSLNRTAVSDEGVVYLQNLPNLVSLGLEQTKIKHLKIISQLSRLRTLNIARNSIAEASEFRCLQEFSELMVLNVSQIDGLLGDAVLHFLSGLELKSLTLPDRHTTTDEGLRHIAGMPLHSLDLTDYIHITDKGIEHVGKIKSLQKLSLSNVKVTDGSMQHIAGLSELVDLNLDRTLITNEGARQLQSLPRLQELSLAGTGISSKFLKTGTLNKCIHLTHLNLSRTNVSSEGITCLTLPRLTHLNLDQTYVTVPIGDQLMKCPALQVIRLNGLKEPSRFYDVEEEED
ncbi:UBX domain-containing protein 4 [Holothuria leucospilota]|uniref:UBX domain-containing protein 4 n=1 Tax=Holothuria leucospilota TaxID=206669 RepID=A0A9Q1CMD1_HOLLE|nr:UBX domain-containing protein 4 [Holothuria leucospilota]